jgi:voltage-gated potassium channel
MSKVEYGVIFVITLYQHAQQAFYALVSKFCIFIAPKTFMYKTTRRKTYILLHPELGHSKWDRLINGFIITLILLNVVAVMLETVPAIHDPYTDYFAYFDLFSVVVFSVEYILRIWCCVEEPRYKHSVYGRMKYVFSVGALIDLLAILPVYLHAFVGLDLRILRILRLARFLRLFRLTHYMKATRIVVNVFRTRKNELILSFILAIFLIIISSSLVYFAEHLEQPEVFSSIPKTIWWSVITLTTVGYGDMVPHTELGKFLTGGLLLVGVAIFALPAGIITAGFLEESRKSNRQRVNCPHCGKQLPDHYHPVGNDPHAEEIDQQQPESTA